MRQFTDIAGVSKGKVVAVHPVKLKGKTLKWLLWCECGNNSMAAAGDFIRSKHLSCGCTRVKKGSDHYSWTGAGLVTGMYIASIRGNAKKFNREFSIDAEYLWKLFEQQRGICALSGIKMEISKNKNINTASADRIDSNKGYIKGNIQWIHKDINRMKSDFKEKYFIDMCIRIAKFRGK